jgi:hypothetical protein
MPLKWLLQLLNKNSSIQEDYLLVAFGLIKVFRTSDSTLTCLKGEAKEINRIKQ